MTVLATKKFMLYCPKCQQTYEEGTLRFCNNDGVRLIASSAGAKVQRKTEGVFSSILGRTPPSRSDRDGRLAEIPRFIQSEQPIQRPKQSFSPPPPPQSQAFKPEPEPKLQIEITEAKIEEIKPAAAEIKPVFEEVKPKIEELRPVLLEPKPVILEPRPVVLEPKPVISEQKPVIEEVKPKIEQESIEKHFITVKPIPRTIKPSEIPSGTASVGNRKTNPAGRDALTWDQPNVLLGQTIKGRYRIAELSGQDEASISYLAEDKIVPNKKVSVRILMNERMDDDPESKILAEEIVSLSHITHPNIASVIDSGELPEGKPFIITELVEGKSIKEMLQRTGQFNSARVARIIRQAAYALSEVHQNGILHRNLKPENIILTISEGGKEQVKLTDFGVLYDEFNESNAAYQAPEQIEGYMATYASDIYSLAVIAYQMLTNRLPFNVSSSGNLLKAQRNGLTIYPTNLRLDLPEITDKILEKALSFSPTGRYPKARDFGDAFFNGITTAAPWEKDSEKKQKIEIIPDETQIEEKAAEIPAPALFKSVPAAAPGLEIPAVKNDIVINEIPEKAKDEKVSEKPRISFEEEEDTDEDIKPPENGSVKTAEELLWEKRSPDPVKVASRSWMLFSVVGLAVLLIACWAVWYMFLNHRSVPVEIDQAPAATNKPTENSGNQNVETSQNALTPAEVNEIPPMKRSVEQPPNTVYFENSKLNLDPNLVKKFLGFSLYYPKDWLKTPTAGNFIDISKKSADGIPVKQMIVTRYDSKGTFSQDQEIFKGLAEKSNVDLKKILPNFQLISSKESEIQNGRWKVYEVKFQNAGKTENGGEIMLWGRRIWIPIQRPGMKSGFVITMLATSLSTDVKDIEDVGVNDELATILETFEPEQEN